MKTRLCCCVARDDAAECLGLLRVAEPQLSTRWPGKTPVNLCDRFQGQVLLVVNTASKCGFTPQYEGLEALHARLHDRGFSVVGFPSNDFMGQEPGSEDEIQEFCTLTYGVKFPMFEKVHVKGDDTTPLYRQLAAMTGSTPGWNFHKYLIDREGKPVANFGSRTTPEDADLLAKIEELLAAPRPGVRRPRAMPTEASAG
jgi:glutathione peroxidase